MASSPGTTDDALKDDKTAFTLTSQEFALGNELFQRSNWPVGSFIVTSVVLGSTISLFLPGEPPGRLDMAIRCLTMSVAIFCGLLALMKFNRIRNRRRTATNYDRSPFGNVQCIVEWNEEGLRVDTDSGYQLYRWKEFRTWCEDDSIIVLFFGPDIYMTLPKRALTAHMTKGLKSRLDQAGLRPAKLFPI